MSPVVLVLILLLLVMVTILALRPVALPAGGPAAPEPERSRLEALLRQATQAEQEGDLRAAFDVSKRALRYRRLYDEEIAALDAAALEEIASIYRRLGWPLSPLEEARRRFEELRRLDHPRQGPPDVSLLTDPAEDARVAFEAAVATLPEPPPPPPSKLTPGDTPRVGPVAQLRVEAPGGLAFAGERLAILGVSGAGLYDASGKKRGELPLPGARALRASPDGLLVLASWERALVADGAGKVLRELPLSGGLLAAAPGAELLAARVGDDLVLLSGEGEQQDRLPVSGALCALFDQRGRLFVGTAHGVIELFDTKTGARLGLLQTRAHEERAAITALALSPDGTLLASGDTRAWLSLYDLETLSELRGLPAGRPHSPPQDDLDIVRGVAFAGGFVVAGLDSGLLSFATPRPLRFGAYLAPASWRPMGPPPPHLIGLASDASARRLAVAFDDGLVALLEP